jgi:hypothetical protein
MGAAGEEAAAATFGNSTEAANPVSKVRRVGLYAFTSGILHAPSMNTRQAKFSHRRKVGANSHCGEESGAS